MMKGIWKLAWATLRHEKKQTLALFFGILLGAALFSGVGSLFSSGLEAAKENARVEYGDWHYEMRCDLPWFDRFLTNPTGEGFTLETYGVETVRKAIDAPFEIQYVSADEDYMQMMGRTVLAGHLPEGNDEITVDAQTLRNLGVAQTLGSTVTVDGETFTLCGIVAEMPEKLNTQMGDHMQVFVGPDLDYGMNGQFLYLKFDESQPVAEQMAAFSAKYGIDASTIARNNGLAGYVGADAASLTPSEIFGALREPSLGIPYIWGLLNENQALTEGAVLLALALFAGFIIYSIFQVSVRQREQQYGVLQALGLTEGGIFGLLLCELFLIFVPAYLLGCAIGNGVAAFIYARSGRIFVARNVEHHGGMDTAQIAASQSVNTLPDAGVFHVDRTLIGVGGIFLALLLVLIAILLVRQMRRTSLRGLTAGAHATPRSRRIISLRRASLTGVLTKRFIFSRKRTFLGILMSLSIGSVIFLGATYVIENTHINNALVFAADDGLGSDIQLVCENGVLDETIPSQTIEHLRVIDDVATVLPVSYMLGEIALDDGSFRWPTYYAETANEPGFEPDPVVMERYGGVIVQSGEDDYRLKVNIYGYDDAMLTRLDDYLLAGTIDPEAMRRDDSVIVKTLVDGQGNYDGIDLAVGDALTVKTPRDVTAADEVLHFDGVAGDYAETTCAVSALVSRPLGKVDTTIGDDSEMTVDLIMTQEQMQKYFGVESYQTVSIALTEKADPVSVADAVHAVTAGIPGCVVRDYTAQIAAQDLYLRQQMLFFYGIAAVLLATSLLHIANSMQYLVAERRREFAILRAMGITEQGFLRMLAREGLRYGIYTSLVVIVCYGLVQHVLNYLLQHVYLYLQPTGGLPPGWLIAVCGVNIALCIATMCAAGRRVLKQSILA